MFRECREYPVPCRGNVGSRVRHVICVLFNIECRVGRTFIQRDGVRGSWTSVGARVVHETGMNALIVAAASSILMRIDISGVTF